MRDQMIGLSWAMLLTGSVLLLLEWLILEHDVFMGVLHVMLTPLLLGAVGLWWFRFHAAVRPGASRAHAPLDTPQPEAPTSEARD